MPITAPIPSAPPPEEVNAAVQGMTPPPQLETFKQGFARGASGQQYATDDNGKVVPISPNVQPTRGGTFGKILAGMVVGALQGATAARPGGIPSHELGGGVGAGAKAAEDYLLKRDLLRRQEAQQNFENTEKSEQQQNENLRYRAEIHLNNLQALKTEHEIDVAKQNDPILHQNLKNAARLNALDADAKAQALGLTNPRTYKSYSEVPQTEIDKIAQQQVKLVPNGDGSVTVYDRKFNPQSTPNAEPFELKELTGLSKDGTPQWKTLGTVDAGAGTVAQLEAETQKEHAEVLDWATKNANVEKSKAQTEQAEAEAERARAQAGLSNAQIKMMGEMGVVSTGNYTPMADDWKLNADQLAAKMTAEGAQLTPIMRQNLPALMALADYTVDPNTFPNRVYNRPGQPPQLDKQHAISFVKMIRPDWSEQTYKATQKLYSDFANTNRNAAGGRLASFDAATRHLGMAVEAAQGLANGNVQLFNRFGNALAQELGKPAPQNFDAIKNILVGEVGFLLTGKSITDQEAHEMEQTINRAQSPAQLAAVAKQYAGAMLAKDAAQIDQFVAWTGKLPPNYLAPSTLQVFKNLGVDINAELGLPAGVGIVATGNRTGAGQVQPNEGQPKIVPQFSSGNVTIPARQLVPGVGWVHAGSQSPITAGNGAYVLDPNDPTGTKWIKR